MREDTTNIRVAVPNDLYSLIEQEQQRRYKETGRKPALASILLEWAKLGSEQNSDQDFEQETAPPETYLPASSKYLSSLENELTRWQRNLQNRQQAIEQKEKALLQKQEELIHYKEGIISQSMLSKKLQWELDQRQREIEEHKKLIAEQKREIKNLREELSEAQADFKEIIRDAQRRTQEDWLIALAPTLTNVINLLSQSSNKQHFQLLQQELIKLQKYLQVPEVDSQSQKKINPEAK